MVAWSLHAALPRRRERPSMSLRDSVIVGFAETEIVSRSDRDVFSLAGDVLDQLLRRTGFEKDQVDGLVMAPSLTATSHPFWAQTVADYLGLELDFCDETHLGGCSAAASLVRSAAAIAAGLCSTVVLINADTPSREDRYRPFSWYEEWTDPYGVMGPPGLFGLLSQRYEHQYGLDYEALAKLAVTQRDHALLNENACKKLRQPLTVADYLNSRMIADPIRLLDCVMPADGANGLIVTRRDIAQRRGLQFVAPLGYGEVTNPGASKSIVDITETGHRTAGERAFAAAGLAPKDIGSFHPYDDFVIAIMIQLEMLGFCKRGQGSAFVRETDFSYHGDLPLNTGGGQISAGQAGLAGGGTNLVEAVRQLFGEGDRRQVNDTSNALVTGIGWIPYGRSWSSSVALILAPDA
jgi:acetyl-CoA acetyltransferase